jgi:hypothetical protein
MCFCWCNPKRWWCLQPCFDPKQIRYCLADASYYCATLPFRWTYKCVERMCESLFWGFVIFLLAIVILLLCGKYLEHRVKTELIDSVTHLFLRNITIT